MNAPHGAPPAARSREGGSREGRLFRAQLGDEILDQHNEGRQAGRQASACLPTVCGQSKLSAFPINRQERASSRHEAGKAAACFARDLMERVMLLPCVYLVTDSSYTETEHIHVFGPCGRSKLSCVATVEELMAMRSDGDAVRSGTNFGTWPDIDSLGIQAEHIHVFIWSIRSLQTIVCNGNRRRWRDTVRSKRESKNEPYSAQNPQNRTFS